MSGVEGFQYWLTIPQLPYILFLGVLAILVPFFSKSLRYSEPVTLYAVLLVFIYTSAVPLPDYFLWLYPIGVLLALTSLSKFSFSKRLLITSLPTYVSLFFINFIIGNGLQAGPFYFAYPLLHQDIVFFNSASDYAAWVFVFNVFLLSTVVVTLWLCFSRSNRAVANTQSTVSAPIYLGRFKPNLKRKRRATLAALVAVIFLLGFAFNAIYSQPITASSDQVFPLYLFLFDQNIGASPASSTYYLSWSGLVVYNNWSQPISFNHQLNLQNTDLDVSFDLQTDHYASYDLLKTNNSTMGLTVAPKVLTQNISAVNVDYYVGSSPQSFAVPLFDNNVTTYPVEKSSYLSYDIDSKSLGTVYIIGFKFENNSSTENMNLYFRNKQCLFTYSISSSTATVSYYDFLAQRSSYKSVYYPSLSVDGWNLLVFCPTYSGFYSWVNNSLIVY